MVDALLFGVEPVFIFENRVATLSVAASYSPRKT